MDIVGSEPTDISVIGQRILQKDVEDDVYLHLSYENGVKAHLHASWLWPQVERRLTAVGTEGMLVYDEIQQTLSLHRKYVDADLVHHDEGVEVLFEGGEPPLRYECQHFLDVMETRAVPMTDGKTALPVIRVLEEAGRQLQQKGVE